MRTPAIAADSMPMLMAEAKKRQRLSPGRPPGRPTDESSKGMTESTYLFPKGPAREIAAKRKPEEGELNA